MEKITTFAIKANKCNLTITYSHNMRDLKSASTELEVLAFAKCPLEVS